MEAETEALVAVAYPLETLADSPHGDAEAADLPQGDAEAADTSEIAAAFNSEREM